MWIIVVIAFPVLFVEQRCIKQGWITAKIMVLIFVKVSCLLMILVKVLTI